MTKIDPATISKWLRAASARAIESNKDARACRLALDALADRLSLEGPPRVGDRVRYYADDTPGVVTDVAPDYAEVRVKGLDHLHQPLRWYTFAELRIIARAGYDCESGRELTP
jgi:hypothetical protein